MEDEFVTNSSKAAAPVINDEHRVLQEEGEVISINESEKKLKQNNDANPIESRVEKTQDDEIIDQKLDTNSSAAKIEQTVEYNTQYTSEQADRDYIQTEEQVLEEQIIHNREEQGEEQQFDESNLDKSSVVQPPEKFREALDEKDQYEDEYEEISEDDIKEQKNK